MIQELLFTIGQRPPSLRALAAEHAPAQASNRNPRRQRSFRAARSLEPEFLNGYKLAFRGAHTKQAFLAGLKAGAREGVFYFCCHGRAEGDRKLSLDDPRLELTDTRTEEEIVNEEEREYIDPNDIDLYLVGDRQFLKGNPVVFLNACEAAKMSAGFYQGFADKFLGHRACALLGPHIEMPIVFARDFAQRFFEELFKGGIENNIGAVLLKLRRDFLLNGANPLGLVYSLYRGADVYIRTPVLKA